MIWSENSTDIEFMEQPGAGVASAPAFGAGVPETIAMSPVRGFQPVMEILRDA